ncbi:MAG: hypothetical protein Q7K16_04805 [Candidatus Azambacteria bacterium]|nr:hypothetical protein [Candidatus Azambacteria bacterium]
MDFPQKLIDEIEFIKTHPEVKVVTTDKEACEIIERHTATSDILAHGVDQKRVENILEEIETKILVYKKKNPFESAKRVIVSGSEQLAGSILIPVVSALESDRRCSLLCVLTDHLAGKQLREKHDIFLKRIDDHSRPYMSEIPASFDIAIPMIDPNASPSSLLLFNAKEVFGIQKHTKIFMIVGGWNGFGGMKSLLAHQIIEPVDGFFCNDKFAKKLILKDVKSFPKHHPWHKIPESKVFVTGTPTTDNIAKENTKKLRIAGRKKLSINSKSFVILYLGDYSYDTPINEKTFSLSLATIINLARGLKKDKHITLVVRPHPSDPNKEKLSGALPKSTPTNLRVVMATPEQISYTESLSVADIVISIISTGNWEAVLRGKRAIFLGYKGKELGYQVLQKTYGNATMRAINRLSGFSVVTSPKALAAKLKIEMHAKPRVGFRPRNAKKSSIKKILNIALSA